jgi:hypothetical protein
MTAAAEGAAGGASAGVSDVEMGLASGSPPATRPNKTTLASVLPRWWRLAARWFTGGAFGPNISDLGFARICRHPWRSCCWVLDRLWFGPSVLSAPASMGCGKVLLFTQHPSNLDGMLVVLAMCLFLVGRRGALDCSWICSSSHHLGFPHYSVLCQDQVTWSWSWWGGRPTLAIGSSIWAIQVQVGFEH